MNCLDTTSNRDCLRSFFPRHPFRLRDTPMTAYIKNFEVEPIESIFHMQIMPKLSQKTTRLLLFWEIPEADDVSGSEVREFVEDPR